MASGPSVEGFEEYDRKLWLSCQVLLQRGLGSTSVKELGIYKLTEIGYFPCSHSSQISAHLAWIFSDFTDQAIT